MISGFIIKIIQPDPYRLTSDMLPVGHEIICPPQASTTVNVVNQLNTVILRSWFRLAVLIHEQHYAAQRKLQTKKIKSCLHTIFPHISVARV